MADNSVSAVIAGLVVGIAFIAIFSFTMKTELSPTDDKIIASANNLPEVNEFFSQYPNAKVEIDRTGSYGSKPIIVYQYEKIYDDGKINNARLFVGLNELTNMPSSITISTDCAVSYVNGFGGISYSEYGRRIVETLKATECAK